MSLTGVNTIRAWLVFKFVIDLNRGGSVSMLCPLPKMGWASLSRSLILALQNIRAAGLQ
jgi:hypothetical protein